MQLHKHQSHKHDGDVTQLPGGVARVTGISGRPVKHEGPSTGDALTWNGKVWAPGGKPVLNVDAFGAKGDDVHDDTQAIQNAFNTAKSIQGEVAFGPKTYKITAPLVVPQEISIKGAGRYVSTIKQHSGNTQILKVTDANSQGVCVSDLKLSYLHQQDPVNHPNSYAIAFMGTVEQGNVNYWTIERLQITAATVGIGELSSLSTYYFWGNHVAEISLSLISKSLIDITATRFHGNPHNYFGKIVHLTASTPAPTGPALKLSGEFTLEGFDCEDWTNQIISAAGNTTSTLPMPAVIRGMHVERHSITQASPLDIIQLQNGKYIVENLDYQTGTGSGTAFAHVLVNTGSADLRLSNVTVWDWGTVGTLSVHGGTSTDTHVTSGISNNLDTGVSVGGTANTISLENGVVTTAAITATGTVQGNRTQQAVVALTYGATVATDASLGGFFSLSVTSSTAFTISNPTNAVNGQIITYDIVNSTTTMGAITWGANFRLAGAFTNPAAGKRRTISFYVNGGFFIEINRAAADI